MSPGGLVYITVVGNSNTAHSISRLAFLPFYLQSPLSPSSYHPFFNYHSYRDHSYISNVLLPLRERAEAGE
jgi:hypothetical protein